MSSIDPVANGGLSAVSGVQPTSMASPPPVGYLQGTLDGVAGLLGLSTPDVRTALKQGSSISDLAAAQGVSRSTVVDTIEAQVQKLRAARGAAPIDATALDRVVNRAIDRRLPSPAQTPPPGTASPDTFAPADGSLDLYA